MTTYSSSERMMGRTPYYPDGFRFLYRPRAQKVYPLEEGGQIHVFTPDECKQYASKIQEYGVAIDQSAFKINYWEARREVVFNVRKDAEVYAAFFEHNDLARVKLLKDSSEKGKEKIWAGAFSRLTTPITDLFNPQEESEEPEVLLKLPFNAYATHEVWEVETDYGPLIVDYLSTIAAESDFVGGGVIGPFLCKQPYKLINPDIFALRAQNGVAPSVVEKADIVERPLIGADVSWDTEQFLKESLGQCFFEKTRHPNDIDMNKLIARSIYPEGESKTYIHGKTRGRAFEITEELWTQEDGVNALSGDGAYLAWWGKGKKEQWEQRRQRKIFAVPYLTASPLTIN